jgi:hypothetical protein
MCFMNFNLLFITLHILEHTNDISFITSCNCSYRHVNLFNKSDHRFGKLDKDCWTNMFNVECIVKLSILQTTLLINAMSKAFVFVKLKEMPLSYNHNNP